MSLINGGAFSPDITATHDHTKTFIKDEVQLHNIKQSLMLNQHVDVYCIKGEFPNKKKRRHNTLKTKEKYFTYS